MGTNTIELKKIMLDKGYQRITELADATGIARNTLGSVLNGKIQPSSAVMSRLVTALDIPPAKAGEIFFSDNLRDK